MKIGSVGLSLIKDFEGFRENPYTCSAGGLTIGFGHKMQKGESATIPLSAADAEMLLRKDLAPVEAFLSEYSWLSQNEFDALCSLIYNIGIAKFQSFKVYTALKMQDRHTLTVEMRDIRTAGGKVLAGLENRRLAEISVFNWGHAPKGKFVLYQRPKS